MVKKVLQFLHTEVRGLHDAAYLLACFAFLSQVLALLRDRLLAHTFGASHVLDVYFAAFRIPDFIFVSIASLVSISVLVPFLAERFQKGEGDAKRFIDQTFSVFFAAIAVASAVAYVAVPYLVPRVLPGFLHDPLLPSLVQATRILLLSPLLLGISNFFASITQMYNRFFLYAVSPLLYNLGIIVGIVFLYPAFGLRGLVFGVVLGAFLHAVIQVPFILGRGMFPRLSFRFKYADVRRVVFLSFPRTLALSSNQIATFFLVAFASLMSAGSIAIFNYALNLQSVPLSIIGVSYSSAAFPLLSRLLSGGKRAEFLTQMITATKHIVFWSTPLMVLFVVLRAQIVRVVLGSGHFNWTDTRLTAAALAMFVLSIIPQALLLLFVRAYYAEGRTWKPMVINLFSSALIVALGFLLMRLFASVPSFRFFIEALFKVNDVPGTAVLMLPLAYTIGVTVNMVIHWIAFEGDFKGYSRAALPAFFQIVSASVVGGFCAYRLLAPFGVLFGMTTLLGIFLQGLCAGLIGIGVIILILILFRSSELKEVWRTLHQKIWRAEVLVPEQTEL